MNILGLVLLSFRRRQQSRVSTILDYTVILEAIKTYIIIYHIVNHIMLCIHFKGSSNE